MTGHEERPWGTAWSGWRLAAGGVLALLVWAAVLPVAAATPAPELSGSVVAGGGGTVSGGAYELSGTLGETAGPALANAGLACEPGFWRLWPELSFRLLLAAQWNFVSVPVVPYDARPAAVFGATVSEPVWTWRSPAYEVADSVGAGVAYWVYCQQSADRTVVGEEVTDYAVTLEHGWNAVGPVGPAGFPAVPLPLPTSPTGACLPDVWGWAAAFGGYAAAAVLEAGHGYWLFVPGAAAVAWLGP